MKQNNGFKNRFLMLLGVLLIFMVGIGYAILSEKLVIDNTVSYDSMKWNVGFTAAEDGWDPLVEFYIDELLTKNGKTLEDIGLSREEFEDFVRELFVSDSLVVPSTFLISQDKKSITVNCKLTKTSRAQACFTKATVTNDSTFYVSLSEEQINLSDYEYIDGTALFWLGNDLYDGLSLIEEGHTMDIGESSDFLFVVFTKPLTEDILPSSELSIPFTITVDFKETDQHVGNIAMLRTYKEDYAIWTYEYSENVKNITFQDKIDEPLNVFKSWDIGISQDGKVIAYLVPNENDSSYYDLFIQSDTQLYANFDMISWFKEFINVESINGLELIDTRYMLYGNDVLDNITNN